MKTFFFKKNLIFIIFSQFISFICSCNKLKNQEKPNPVIESYSYSTPEDLNKKNKITQEEYKKFNFKVYDETAKSKLENLEIQIKGQLEQGISNSYTIFESKDFIITYESLWSIFTIGSKLMMIDLDYKDPYVGNNEKEIIEKLTAYANYHNLAFAYRLSDRGIHVFLVSKTFDKKNLINNVDETKNDEIKKIMFENGCEDRYIVFSKLRNSFNTRIGPKPFEISSGAGPGTKLRTQDDLKKEFISKKPLNDIIGDKNLVDLNLYKLLLLNDNLVSYMNETYQNDYDQIWSKTKKYTIHRELKDFIKNRFTKKIKQFALSNHLAITDTYQCDYKGDLVS